MNGDNAVEQTESLSSVTLKRNSKGGTEIIVKSYNKEIADASSKATKEYNSLCAEYQVSQ